jgi:hypothetical protein
VDLDRRAAFLLPLSLVGCRKTATAEGAAAAFLDAYYVERDHDRALAVSTGSARARVQHEKDLRSEAGGAYGVSPRVYYAVKGQPKATPEGQELTYEMTIDSSGVQLRKEVRVLVKKEGEDWKVAVFGERDVDAQ